MALQVGCKARNLVAEIQLRQGENDQNRANMLRGELQRKRLTITVLSYVADMLATLKSLVSWLDRWVAASGATPCSLCLTVFLTVSAGLLELICRL